MTVGGQRAAPGDDGATGQAMPRRRAPPLSLGLRDSGRPRWAPCSFGVPPSPLGQGGNFPAFISPSRSFCLSVSGAVAPSAPGAKPRPLPRELGWLSWSREGESMCAANLLRGAERACPRSAWSRVSTTSEDDWRNRGTRRITQRERSVLELSAPGRARSGCALAHMSASGEPAPAAPTCAPPASRRGFPRVFFDW